MTDYPKFASITAKAVETVQERRTRARDRGWVGDKKEEEEEEKKNFCAHIIFKKWRIKCYLHHGGFFLPLSSRSTVPLAEGLLTIREWPNSPVLSEKQTWVGGRLLCGSPN